MEGSLSFSNHARKEKVRFSFEATHSEATKRNHEAGNEACLVHSGIHQKEFTVQKLYSLWSQGGNNFLSLPIRVQPVRNCRHSVI